MKIDGEKVGFLLGERGLYVGVKVWKDGEEKGEYYIIKMGYRKVGGFVEVGWDEGKY